MGANHRIKGCHSHDTDAGSNFLKDEGRDNQEPDRRPRRARRPWLTPVADNWANAFFVNLLFVISSNDINRLQVNLW